MGKTDRDIDLIHAELIEASLMLAECYREQGQVLIDTGNELERFTNEDGVAEPTPAYLETLIGFAERTEVASHREHELRAKLIRLTIEEKHIRRREEQGKRRKRRDDYGGI